MARLIDADELLQKMESVGGNGYTVPNMIYMVKHAPAVDAEPVRRGKWIKHYLTFECPKCGTLSVDKGKYCPNCGAKMEEEIENG